VAGSLGAIGATGACAGVNFSDPGTWLRAVLAGDRPMAGEGAAEDLSRMATKLYISWVERMRRRYVVQVSQLIS